MAGIHCGRYGAQSWGAIMCGQYRTPGRDEGRSPSPCERLPNDRGLRCRRRYERRRGSSTARRTALWTTMCTPWGCPEVSVWSRVGDACGPVSYTHLRAHETRHDLVCRLLLEKKKK